MANIPAQFCNNTDVFGNPATGASYGGALPNAYPFTGHSLFDAPHNIAAQILFPAPTAIQSFTGSVAALNPSTVSAAASIPSYFSLTASQYQCYGYAALYYQAVAGGAWTLAQAVPNRGATGGVFGLYNGASTPVVTSTGALTVTGLRLVLQGASVLSTPGFPEAGYGDTTLTIASLQYTTGLNLSGTTTTTDCVAAVNLSINETTPNAATVPLDTTFSLYRQTDSAGAFFLITPNLAATIVGNAATANYYDTAIFIGHTYQYQIVGNQTGAMTLSTIATTACVSPAPAPGLVWKEDCAGAPNVWKRDC